MHHLPWWRIAAGKRGACTKQVLSPLFWPVSISCSGSSSWRVRTWTGPVGASTTRKSWIVYTPKTRDFWKASADRCPFGISKDLQSKKTGSTVRCSSDAALTGTSARPASSDLRYKLHVKTMSVNCRGTETISCVVWRRRSPKRKRGKELRIRDINKDLQSDFMGNNNSLFHVK